MQKGMFRRKESPASRSIQRGAEDYQPSDSLELKRMAPQEQRPPLRQTHSLRSLDSLDRDEWGSTDDEGSVKSLVTLRERALSSRRLRALERRSKRRGNKVSTMEASTMDLRALISSREWKHVMRKINSEPRLISEKQEIELIGQRTQAYPLHQVASLRPPINIVDAMVAVFPDACRLPDDVLGKLPLHIACQCRASSEVQRGLLVAFPDAVRLTDTVERRLPLHYACIDGYPNDVSMLIAAERRALTAKDVHGKTPVDLCQESISPHRDSILKRMYEIAKYEGGMGLGSSKKRKEKQQQAPATPANEEALKLPIESPSEMSEMTVNTSNLTKEKSNGPSVPMLSPMKSGKAKSILPNWARGRKANADSQHTSNARDSSMDTEKRSNVPKEVKKRGASLERLRSRRKTFQVDSLPLLDTIETDSRPMETLSLPSKPVSEEVRSPTGSSYGSTASGKKSRKKKKIPRNREDSVPELPANVVQQSSVPLHESLEHEEPLTDLSAPSVVRHKKKGLAQTSDLMKILDQEEREASRQANSHDTRILPLPFGDTPERTRSPEKQRSPEKRAKPAIPLVPRLSENGHRSPAIPRPKSERTSSQPKETERFHHNEAERNHHSMPPISSPSPSTVERNAQSSSALAVDTNLSMDNNEYPNRQSDARALTPRDAADRNGMGGPENMAKQRHLHLRKAALIEECNHANDLLIKKRAQAQISRREIDLLESRMRDLQIALEKQRVSLDMTVGGIRVHEEILAEHYGKIKAVDRELAALTTAEPRASPPSPGCEQPPMTRKSPRNPMRAMPTVTSSSESSSSSGSSTSGSSGTSSSGTGTSSSDTGTTSASSRPASPSWVRWQKDKMLRESQQGPG